MSTANSTDSAANSPAMAEEEEPRKKGARGGKRSVTHLSKAQLARKRANDREAQRNIRQRTKEHIESLEKKVKELESGRRSNSMERVLRRNKELEGEVEELRAQLEMSQQIPRNSSPRTTQVVSPELEEEYTLQQEPDIRTKWVPIAQSGPPAWSVDSLPAPINGMHATGDLVLDQSFPISDQVQMYPARSTSFDNSDDPSQMLFATMTPIWDDPTLLAPQANMAGPPAVPSWTPFHPSLSQPSRFADLQPTGFSEVINTPSYTETTSWQQQPSIYAWQISTKLKAPVTHVDQLMFSVIHSQRHLHITSDATGEAIIGPEFPSVHMLFNQPGPSKPPSTLTEVMARYSAVLSNRGFALIPEKLASFMCMYRFVQWQISPTYQTYQALHDWQAPTQAQLEVAHPAWMDLPPWPKFREKVILDQVRYDNIEFQNDYATNLSVNFPYDPMKALVFEDGQIKVSKMMERHLSNIANMSMKKPFADKYPEFRDYCRFDEV